MYLKVISVTKKKEKGEPDDTITQEQFNIRANGRRAAVIDRENSIEAWRAEELELMTECSHHVSRVTRRSI